jgi:hypothetical protein
MTFQAISALATLEFTHTRVLRQRFIGLFPSSTPHYLFPTNKPISFASFWVTERSAANESIEKGLSKCVKHILKVPFLLIMRFPISNPANSTFLVNPGD